MIIYMAIDVKIIKELNINILVTNTQSATSKSFVAPGLFVKYQRTIIKKIMYIFREKYISSILKKSYNWYPKLLYFDGL